MMKKESDSCALAPPSSTPAPPGFTKSKSVCKENGPLSYMHEQNQTPDDFCEEQPPRRTSRKRSRPEFCAITTPRPPTPARLRIGRPPRSGYQSPLETRSCPQFYVPTTARAMRGQRRRGRPPKAGYEKAQNLSSNYQISEGIDPKSLQQVPNALQHMVGTQTALDDAKVISRSSDINKNLVHTLKAITERYGDITQDSLLESDFIKTSVLRGICEMVQDLQKKQLKDLDISTLGSYYTAVSDLENMKVDVQWLRSRLDEIKDALNLSDEAQGIIIEKEGRLGNINRKKKELERLKSEVQDIEVQLARDVVMVDELNKKFDYQMSKIAQFEHANFMDGLI